MFLLFVLLGELINKPNEDISQMEQFIEQPILSQLDFGHVQIVRTNNKWQASNKKINQAKNTDISK